VTAGADELFAAAADRLCADDPRVELGKIMHSTGLKVGGKIFGFVTRGELVLKLPAARVDELLAKGGRRFDAGRRRPMREWVCVSPADVDECAGYLREARRFVGGAASSSGAGA
jgi:hypothetical protein